MKYLLLITLITVGQTALAVKVESDPTTQDVTDCGVILDTNAKVTLPALGAAGSKYCSYDVSGVAVGSHKIQMSFIRKDPLWGDLESAMSTPPFQFVRPSTPVTAPTGIALKP